MKVTIKDENFVDKKNPFGYFESFISAAKVSWKASTVEERKDTWQSAVYFTLATAPAHFLSLSVYKLFLPLPLSSRAFLRIFRLCLCLSRRRFSRALSGESNDCRRTKADREKQI